MSRLVNLDELERLYYDERLTQAQVAERLGVSQQTIHRRMAVYQIDARPPGKRPVRKVNE